MLIQKCLLNKPFSLVFVVLLLGRCGETFDGKKKNLPASDTSEGRASAHLEDLRNWRALGLPVAAEWNINLNGGYSLKHHVEQVRKGHRFLPSIRLLAASTAYDFESAESESNAELLYEQISPEDWNYLKSNRVPITLRTNNIVNAFTQPRYRKNAIGSFEELRSSPLVLETVAGSVNGSYFEKNLVDVFSSTENWAKEGEFWARSATLKRLQNLIPDPAYIIFLENNEGLNDKLTLYLNPVIGAFDLLGVPHLVFKPVEEIKAMNWRLGEFVEDSLKTYPPGNASSAQITYWEKRRDQYLALYEAFESNLSLTWQRKTTKTAYDAMSLDRLHLTENLYNKFGYSPELSYYDASSNSLYIKGTNLVDFTSQQHLMVLNSIPRWEEAEKKNPKAYRELSLWITEAGVLAGAEAGRHEVITPNLYKAWVHWILWAIHEPGVPVILRRFVPYDTTPEFPMFSTLAQEKLKARGYESLVSISNSAYELPILEAVDEVAQDPILREFWLRGEPILVPDLKHPYVRSNFPHPHAEDNRWRFLECSANLPRQDWVTDLNDGTLTSIKVWSVATKLGDEALLYAWSPISISGLVKFQIPGFGEVEVEAPNPRGYWLIDRGIEGRPGVRKYSP